MTQAIESVVDLIELGAIAPEDIVKCLRSALTETRQWQGLTDEERGITAAETWGSVLIAPQSYQAFARAIEAKLKEKNG